MAKPPLAMIAKWYHKWRVGFNVLGYMLTINDNSNFELRRVRSRDEMHKTRMVNLDMLIQKAYEVSFEKDGNFPTDINTVIRWMQSEADSYSFRIPWRLYRFLSRFKVRREPDPEYDRVLQIRDLSISMEIKPGEPAYKVMDRFQLAIEAMGYGFAAYTTTVEDIDGNKIEEPLFEEDT